MPSPAAVTCQTYCSSVTPLPLLFEHELAVLELDEDVALGTAPVVIGGLIVTVQTAPTYRGILSSQSRIFVASGPAAAYALSTISVASQPAAVYRSLSSLYSCRKLLMSSMMAGLFSSVSGSCSATITLRVGAIRTSGSMPLMSSPSVLVTAPVGASSGIFMLSCFMPLATTANGLPDMAAMMAWAPPRCSVSSCGVTSTSWRLKFSTASVMPCLPASSRRNFTPSCPVVSVDASTPSLARPFFLSHTSSAS